MNSTPREGGGALDVERLLDSIESGDVTPRYTPLDIIRLAEELNALTSGEPFDVSEVRSPGDGTGASHYMAALVADSAALVGVEDLEAGWLFSPRPFPFAAPVGSTDPDDWPGLDGDDWRAEASSAFKQAAEVFGTRRRRWADLAAYESALVRELGEAGRAWDRAFGTLRGLFWGTWGAAVVSEGWTAETTGLDTFAWSENVPDALRQYLDGEGDTSAVITRPSSWTPGLLHVWNSAIAATHSEDVCGRGGRWTGSSGSSGSPPASGRLRRVRRLLLCTKRVWPGQTPARSGSGSLPPASSDSTSSVPVGTSPQPSGSRGGSPRRTGAGPHGTRRSSGAASWPCATSSGTTIVCAKRATLTP